MLSTESPSCQEKGPWLKKQPSFQGKRKRRRTAVRPIGGHSRAYGAHSTGYSMILEWARGVRRPLAACSTSSRSGAARSPGARLQPWTSPSMLPGMDESNIDVKFSDGTLTIKGEKKDEREEKQKDYYLSERRYGSFQRSFGVPDGVDADKIEAHFKNGVLTVTLPKRPEAQKSEKKIAIKKA